MVNKQHHMTVGGFAGKLTARSMCAVIAHLQPESAIIIDESLTSGGAYWELS